jgi:uncharacterized iron-regulated protein
MKFTTIFFLFALMLSVFISVGAQHAESVYIPQRVFHSEAKQFTDFESMLGDLAKADFVFVGEQHDDPATHKLERAVLEGLLRRRGASVVVAMEMFERDVQAVIDDYFAGKISEEEFLKQSRPWPRYATDYRPMVEFAKAHGWKLIASNVPRPIARKVSQGGLAEIDKLPASERGFAARQNNCPLDDYFNKFAATMSSHPGASTHGNAAGGKPESKPRTKEEQEKEAAANRAIIEKFYYAQCVKDETMGESIADTWKQAASPKPVIVHYNGAFHSDYGLGTAARAKQRAKDARSRIITVIPVDSLEAINVDEYKKRGDYVVFCLKPKNTPAASGGTK